MKQQPKPGVKKPAKKELPAPMPGTAQADLIWDTTSPLAHLIFEDLEREPPAEKFWATVSGAATFFASVREADAARVAYESTQGPLMRRVRKVAWLYRDELATQNAMRLWKALLEQLVTEYPEASAGQLWVLVRNALRTLRAEAQLVKPMDADARCPPRIILASRLQALRRPREREAAVAKHAQDRECESRRESAAIHFVGKDRCVDAHALVLQERRQLFIRELRFFPELLQKGLHAQLGRLFELHRRSA